MQEASFKVGLRPKFLLPSQKTQRGIVSSNCVTDKYLKTCQLCVWIFLFNNYLNVWGAVGEHASWSTTTEAKKRIF